MAVTSTSASTVTEIQDELVDNIDYEQTNSVTKAQNCVTLLKMLIIKRTTSSSHEGSSHSFDHASLQTMLDEAQTFVSLNSANGQVRHLGIGDWR